MTDDESKKLAAIREIASLQPSLRNWLRLESLRPSQGDSEMLESEWRRLTSGIYFTCTLLDLWGSTRKDVKMGPSPSSAERNNRDDLWERSLEELKTRLIPGQFSMSSQSSICRFRASPYQSYGAKDSIIPVQGILLFLGFNCQPLCYETKENFYLHSFENREVLLPQYQTLIFEVI